MTDRPEQQDLVEPASHAARILLAVLIIILIAAILISKPLFGWLGDWLGQDPDRILERFDIFIAWIAVFSVPLVVGGALIVRNGWRSTKSGRFPPSGMWVLFDTPVEIGARAVFRGRMLMLGGFLMCAVAICMPAVLWYIVHAIAAAT